VQFEVRLEPQPRSVAEARRRVRLLLTDAHREDLVDSCTLLVSEMVTNALLHAGTTIDLKAVLGADGVRVEVGDGSAHLPSRRRYATTAGTGRGLQMLESMVDDWGVTRHRHGKTVWFELSTADKAVDAHREAVVRRTDGTGAVGTRGGTVQVELLNMPLLLHAAWQEHAEALLREYLLFSLDSEEPNPIQLHADATDAIALLEEHIPWSRVRTITDELLEDATEPNASAAVVRVPVPVASVPHFRTLDRAIEAALLLSATGQVLTPPTQPEVQVFRRWICRQVLEQADDNPAEPFSVPVDRRQDPVRPPGWDAAIVTRSGRGVIAANTQSQIIAVSAEAARILGYDDAEDLLGRRIVAIVPQRLRQAHIAGFTMYLLVGRRPLLDTPVTFPALRRDGSEVDIELLVRDTGLGEGRSVLLADIRLAGDRPASGIGAAG
jgi:PAS domain S-box-containing protein